MKDQIALFPNEQPQVATLLRPLEQERRAIEDVSFPFDQLSIIAEQESWRKEINRPIYHVHKWWAQRLGSVFRGLVLGSFFPVGTDILDLFYKPTRIDGAVVFDPFMGSGTTLGEALKLGATAIGQDINPVAFFLVKNALNLPEKTRVMETYRAIEADTAPLILDFYSARLPDGRLGQVLYFFWVKVVKCPDCKHSVDLFSSYVFSQHAYPRRIPEVRIVCPTCGNIHVGTYGADRTECPSCRGVFNPQVGPVHRGEAKCPSCERSFRIVDAVRQSGRLPDHRLYAKLTVDTQGQKLYLAADGHDEELYRRAVSELSGRKAAFPVVEIRPGHNTNQVLNYCYRYWHEMFNARQLLCLSILCDRIKQIKDERQRNVFCCLFSGTLEFNNMFASFKGEGTGAVRHMFSHHVLKPERAPIEANVWGTPKSSGAFSTLFKTRILRAIEYAENPFEIKPNDRQAGATSKVFNVSAPLAFRPVSSHEDLSDGARLLLRCGDSGHTELPSESVDAVITDPPFFDNVHYSELADFFHVWQRHVLGDNGGHVADTTRSDAEVQNADAELFEERLASVWKECNRVLKGSGLLVFTFHHSRSEGWQSLLGSLNQSGFQVIKVHPIRSEMSVATPKHQAKEPSGLDIVFVCRKLAVTSPIQRTAVAQMASSQAKSQLGRLLEAGFPVSVNDIRAVVISNAIQLLSTGTSANTVDSLVEIEGDLETAAKELARTYSRMPVTETVSREFGRPFEPLGVLPQPET